MMNDKGHWRITQGGMFSTLQDAGRFHQAHLGLPPSGALDRPAMRRANRMVNNPADAAVIEITLTGLSFQTTVECSIAVSGACFELQVNQNRVSDQQTIHLNPGDHFSMGQLLSGARAYLAVAGGFDVPLYFGSHSTYSRAQLGGFQGRAFEKGDRLALKRPHKTNSQQQATWQRPKKTPRHIIRALPGPEYPYFSDQVHRIIWSQAVQVGTDSDRMGLRITTSQPLLSETTITSAGLIPGTLQVTPSGAGIISLNDGPCTGGYPRLLQVVPEHIHLLAQIKPNERIHWFRNQA